MKHKQLLIGTVLMLCLLQSVIAMTTYEETSSVARIVGDSPSEILMQMNRDEIHIQHAMFFAEPQTASDGFFRLLRPTEKKRILDHMLPYDSNLRMFGATPYTFDAIGNNIQDMSKNELIIIEAEGNHRLLENPLNKYSIHLYDSIDTHGVREWQHSFTENNPLLILDAPYAGSYFAKEDSFVTRLVRDSTIIAPTSYNDPEFVRSILCHIADGMTAGELFRLSRNFYYNAGSREPFGLVMQSYALYGNPLQRIYMDWSQFDRHQIANYCKNFLSNLAPDIEYLGQEGDFSKFRKHVVFTIPDYTIDEEDGFAIINASSTFQRYDYGELVLPVAIRTTSFPKNTIITAVNVTDVSDAISLTVPNLATFNGDLVPSVCNEHAREYVIDFTNAYSPYTHDVVATIIPVEVHNCETGELTLYRSFNYTVDYIPLTPAAITSVDAPYRVRPGERVTAYLSLMQTITDVQNGTLSLFDRDGTIVWSRDVATDVTEHIAVFDVPDRKGSYRYSAEFMQDNTTLSYYEFTIDVVLVDDRTRMPVHVRDDMEVPITIISYNNQTVPASITYIPFVDGVVYSDGLLTLEQDIVPGINELPYLLPLPQSYQSYTLVAEIKYLDYLDVFTHLVTLNNAPQLYTLDALSVMAPEPVVIPYPSYDIDGDALDIAINDSRFTLNGTHAVWVPPEEANETFSVLLSASDDYLTTEMDYHITVTPYVHCEASWTCTEWSSCLNGFSTRSCSDVNSCGTEEDMPHTTEVCDGSLKLITTFSDNQTTAALTNGTVYLRIKKTDAIHNASLRIGGSS